MVVLALNAQVFGQSREEKVRNDRKKIELMGTWIYNDIETGFERARKSGKPVMVVLRCIPCEECVKLDDELIEQHPAIKNLLTQFVQVRQVATNGIDLRLFQFDYDQSFTVFFFNADGTIYGRYGTRSHQTEWEDDVSVEGLAKAMRAALALHKDFPTVRPKLLAKTGPKPEFARPELFPLHQGRFTSELDYKGQVVKSCIHCHQVGDAIKSIARDRDVRLPPKVLFPYPNPKVLGLKLDPKETAVVKAVEDNSPASRAGLQAGDRIREANQQPLISIADLQWVLHNVPDDATSIPLTIERDGMSRETAIELPKGWRERDDIAWRASTWELRRWGLGGMVLEPCEPSVRRQLGLDDQAMAFHVKHVGQYAPHNVAQLSGIQAKDIVIAIDDRRDMNRETDVLRYTLNEKKPGDTVVFEIIRDGKTTSRSIVLPK
jgi:hypothetical protein